MKQLILNSISFELVIAFLINEIIYVICIFKMFCLPRKKFVFALTSLYNIIFLKLENFIFSNVYLIRECRVISKILKIHRSYMKIVINLFATRVLSAEMSLLYGNSVPLMCTNNIFYGNFMIINKNVLKNLKLRKKDELEITIKD